MAARATRWLNAQLTDNVNINLTCNAFWSPGAGTVNFYRSGGGCRNTGEIAGIFLHEWGHGMSQNDGAGSSNPDEAYADIASFLLTHNSCIGRGFTRDGNCGGYGNACLSCSGRPRPGLGQARDHTPSTPGRIHRGAAGGGGGPCGREVHCEGYLIGQTVWDLATRDLPAAGHRRRTRRGSSSTSSGTSRARAPRNALYGCGATVATRSCARDGL